MTARPSDADVIEAANATGFNFSAASELLKGWGFTQGVGRDSVRRRLEAISDHEELDEEDFELMDEPISSDPDVEELLRRRGHDFERKKKAYAQQRRVKVKINVDGPIGLGWFGDPHIDDDGTDVNLMFEHAKLFDGRHEALFGNCVGDFRNLWIGNKLTKKHAHQTTTNAQAQILLRAFMEAINWLIVVKGNHDCWAGDDDLLDWLCEQVCKVTRAHRVVVDLVFPNGKEISIYVAHTFKGSSMWSSSYAPARKAQLHRGCRMYICGHLHDGSYQHGFHPDGRMWHAMRLGSYKYIDDYVEILDIEPTESYVCPVSIINPYATSETNLITWELDPYEGVERLKWMRRRWKNGKL